ncbi:MAG: hypothetical protein D6796_01635 [Caldilineae bacterium]|nr:MAG: hypothetical protein D6796_01635 [Caldilineae bacterium]
MDLPNTDDKGLAYIRSEEEFNRARRKALVQEILSAVSGHNLDLLSFDEVVTRLRLRQTVNRGLQDIPLRQIAGSCGRYTDFTRTFLPRRAGRDKERWRQIYTLAATGKGFPPIEVYKIDQVYFVKDGNHRVSVARELGWETIQAYVTELPTVFTLTPDIEPDRLLIKEECALFLEKTRLHELRPEADIVFTAPGRYNRLLKQIAVHGYYLAKERGEKPSPAEVVTHWYDTFYAPMIARLKASGVMRFFPNRTADDLLAWMVEHQKRLRVDHHLDEVGYTPDVDDFLQHVDELTIWDVAKVEVEAKLKKLLGKETDNAESE